MHTAVTAAELKDGSLAYALKNGSDTNWIQTATHPIVGEGKAVVKVTYVVEAATVATTYTNAKGEIIAPYTETPEKADHIYDGWSDATAENGDITKTAIFYHNLDITENGGVGVDDVILALRKLVGYDEEFEETRVDLNKDGRLGIFDAVLLLQYIANN